MSSRKQTRSPPSPPRAFAPAFGRKKAKIDPYADLAPKDNLSYMKYERDEEADRGSWATMDPETGTRQWDKKHKRHEKELEQAGSESCPVRKTDDYARESPWMSWGGETPSQPTTGRSDDAGGTKPAETSKGRLERPDLDIDPEVRKHFVDTRHIMWENAEPASAFERRNKSYLKEGSTGKIVNMIGGEVVSTVHQKVDDRAEFRDRDGEYVDGKDRGLMKKRFEAEWIKRLENRDEQMAFASKMKREWDALPQEEQERRRVRAEKNRAMVESLSFDISEGEEIPSVYLRDKDADKRLEWKFNGYDETGPEEITFGTWDEPQVELPERSRRQIEKDRHRSRWTSSNRDNHSGQAKDSTAASSASVARHYQLPGKPSTSSQGSRAGRDSWVSDSTARRPVSQDEASRFVRNSPPAPTVSVRSDATPTISDIYQGPDLALLQDIPGSPADLRHIEGDTQEMEGKLDKITQLSGNRGRIVAVTLHKPVVYNMSALVERIRGGVIQELQFFPAERMCLLVFLYPPEASAFVRHDINVRENDPRQHGRQQIDVEWYKGLEIDAVYPVQTWTLASVIASDTTRVVFIEGVPVAISLRVLEHDLKAKLTGKLLVKVKLIMSRKRYVRDRVGNSAILEFASIRDAVAVHRLFTEHQVREYERCTVSYLKDTIDAPPNIQPYCDCIHCR